MDSVGITIIGAGVIGLAIAAALSRDGEDIVVLEQHEHYGMETSSRNSEVIHAGIYYPQDSLKARLCVEGADILYRYCERHQIRHKRIGKLIVARSADELSALEAIFSAGQANGVRNLLLIDQQHLKAMEPHVKAVAAVFSPQTGIIDAHGLMRTLYQEACAGGAIFSLNSQVVAIDPCQTGYQVSVQPERYCFKTDILINAAGLHAYRIAGMTGIDPDAAGYRIHYWKGSYFSYAKPSPIRHLLYPLPHAGLTGLGIHATLDLGGRLRFGPDAEPVDQLDYHVDAAKCDHFYRAAASMIEGLQQNAFTADMAGVRPKLSETGFRDFIIRHEADRSLSGLINLIGIESPGLTSCLAIARMVGQLVHEIRS
jgi:L-2-hydroxyglutarate oxidase LhgO